MIDIHDAFAHALINAGICTTRATTAATTMADMERAAALVHNLLPEPIGEWMRSKGAPPEDWHLVLNESMRGELGPFPPSYVRFSHYVEQAIFVRKGLHDLPTASEPPQ